MGDGANKGNEDVDLGSIFAYRVLRRPDLFIIETEFTELTVQDIVDAVNAKQSRHMVPSRKIGSTYLNEAVADIVLATLEFLESTSLKGGGGS